MVDYHLTAKTALGGFSMGYDGVTLAEITGKALVSIAIPAGRKDALSKAIAKAFKAKLPKVGSSTVSGNGNAVFLGMQIDQLFMMFDHDADNAVGHVAGKLGDKGYYTDQSDSWVTISITGAKARQALERICMIDLNELAFPQGSVARTVMEHLGTIVYYQGDDAFLVLTARSSGKSLLHALEISIRNVASKP